MKILRSYALTLLRSLKKPAFIFFALLFCFSLGCNKYKGPLPNVYVNFTVIPNDAFYYDLMMDGGHMYFTGGVNGIVVYRISEFLGFSAFDRACPYDWEDEEAYIVVENDGITLKCRKCGSMYQILDGGRIKGPSKYPLKQYYTKFDGTILRIHS